MSVVQFARIYNCRLAFSRFSFRALRAPSDSLRQLLATLLLVSPKKQGIADDEGHCLWRCESIPSPMLLHLTCDFRHANPLYCSDKKTAVYAMRSVGKLRICPNCEEPFIPGAGNVTYHTVKCREAYRVKRFRWREKQVGKTGSVGSVSAKAATSKSHKTPEAAKR